MGLVDYSDSESDNDSPETSAPVKTTAPQPPKKSFQKLIDKTNPGKILVNLPSASVTDDTEPIEEPAAKRVKTGGGRFSGFGSFLPAPKATAKPTVSRTDSNNKPAPRVGINLKTSSEAAFSRDAPASTEYGGENSDGLPKTNSSGGSGLKLPPPKSAGPSSAQPSIPEGQKPESEVKLVGKPLMFKPLSVARKPGKKNAAKAPATAKANTLTDQTTTAGPTTSPADTKEAAPAKKKISLFSIEDDIPVVEAAPDNTPSYEPEFTSYDNSYSDVQQYTNYTQPLPTSSADPNSLDSIADDLNLDPIARRELFGRGGPGAGNTAKSVINFNLDQEYKHNEELRASGALDQQQHNPLRAIKAGKHSLQQLVNAVQTQRDALEENFAKNRATQKQSGSKYGWR